MIGTPRVMHVVLSLGVGGAEQLVVELSRRLHPGIATAVCCLDDEGVWADGLRREGIPVDVLGRQPGFHPRLGLQIAAAARRHGASVVHCHQYSPFVYGSLAGLLHPLLRIVFTEHGRVSDAPPSRKRTIANRILGRRPSAIVAVSHELRAFMIAEGFPAGHVQVIHNGVDPGIEISAGDETRARLDLGLAPDTFVVGSVARFEPVKRLEQVIDAFAIVAAHINEARLVLVGDGSERTRLEERVAARGLTGAVSFTGIRTDARALVAAFDVYVNSSISEGVSVTLLEAMAASRAIVATRVGGTPEVIEDTVTGQLVPAGQADALAEAILRLQADPSMAASHGAAARLAVVQRFSIDRMINAYVAVYGGQADVVREARQSESRR